MKNIEKSECQNKLSRFEDVKEQIEQYDKVTRRIKELLKRKQVYNDLINEENLSEEAEKFRIELNLFNLIKAKGDSQQNRGCMEYLLSNNFQLRDYILIGAVLEGHNMNREKILSEKHLFQECGDDENHYHRHAIVKTNDNELICMLCGATTKGCYLCREDLEFLTLCAKTQGMFISEVAKEELPLLKVLLEEKNERARTRTPLHEIEEDFAMSRMNMAEEYYLEDEATISDIQKELTKARMLDAEIFEIDHYRVNNPKYLDSVTADKLLAEIELTSALISLETERSRFAELQLEMCRTYKYEVLILSGNNIPTLYNYAPSEEDKIAIVKAYYNLSNQNYRTCSEYFNFNENELDAVFYACRTAHPEINKKLMAMKVKR